MDIKFTSGNIVDQQVGSIVVNLFEGSRKPTGATKAVDIALDGLISTLIENGEIKGKTGELTLIHTGDKITPSHVLVAGLGKPKELTIDNVRTLAAETCRRLRNAEVQSVATIMHGAGAGGLDLLSCSRAFVEGCVMGLYRFDKHKTLEIEQPTIDQLTLVDLDSNLTGEIEQGIRQGEIIAQAVNLCRDMVNEPANYMTPTRMSEIAETVASETGQSLQVLDANQMEALGMGALLGVAQGTYEPPKFIILRHIGDKSKTSTDLALLGKGITFDSGGLDLKTAQGMRNMKGDMGGGAAVIATMKAIGLLQLAINIMAIVPATENMPGHKAQRPGDIVKTMNGKTVEIDNTDAEGRLVLADAVAYARSQNIARIIDVATLTGAVKIALGGLCTGAFGNNKEFTQQVVLAGNDVGERTWQLPIFEEYKEHYKSDVADLKNAGGQGAGAITGAMFIGEFAGDSRWVHLDTAGTNMSDKNRGYNPKGATGVPVRTLIELVDRLSKS